MHVGSLMRDSKTIFIILLYIKKLSDFVNDGLPYITFRKNYQSILR